MRQSFLDHLSIKTLSVFSFLLTLSLDIHLSIFALYLVWAADYTRTAWCRLLITALETIQKTRGLTFPAAFYGATFHCVQGPSLLH